MSASSPCKKENRLNVTAPATHRTRCLHAERTGDIRLQAEERGRIAGAAFRGYTRSASAFLFSRATLNGRDESERGRLRGRGRLRRA
jgi:hypothetical protein